MRHAVILAGGSGTRLWPASRRAHPKQFLALGGDPLIVSAVELGHQIAPHAVLVVTSEEHAEKTRQIVENHGDVRCTNSACTIAVDHFVGVGTYVMPEPSARNTAAAIGLAASEISGGDPDAVIVVLPADQHIRDREGMARTLKVACATVEATDVIATIGILPTRPETGFGYLEVDGQATPGLATEVLRFVEKPDAATAQHFVDSGRFLWNAGIFVMRARRLMAELDAHLPETAQAVREIVRLTTLRSRAHELYANVPSISIDHGIMEKVRGVVTVPASVGWDDVGSWAALPALHGADADNNTVVGKGVVIDGSGNIVMSDDGTVIAAIGVSDLVVVKSGDAILVIPKSQAQDVRKVADAFAARKLEHHL